MTNEEAIKKLDSIKGNYIQWMGMPDDRCEALDLAVSALEKQIAKKPRRIVVDRVVDIYTGEEYAFIGNKFLCPCCNKLLKKDIGVCLECYQRIDWEEGDGE